MVADIVVKGVGIVSPLGRGKKENLSRMRAGESAIKKFPTPWGERLMAKVDDSLIPEELTSFPRPVRFGYLAIKEAIEEAGLTPEETSSGETAFIFSTSKGDFSYLEKEIDKNFWQNFLPHGASTYLAKLFNLRGPQLVVVGACATGGQVIARAMEMLLEGKIKRVIVGVSEAPLTSLLLAGYEKMGVLSHRGMRPFDRHRDGFSLAEGAVSLVLEKGGDGLGKVLGFSLASSGSHPLKFDLEGDALAHSLRDFTLKNDFFPDYINTHGTATRFGDLYETIQIKKAFGKKAYKIPISSTKSMTGHLLGVSGLLEFALTLLSLREGFLPATFGLKERDPLCDLNYIAGRPLSGQFHNFLTISYGFGGPIACVFGRV